MAEQTEQKAQKKSLPMGLILQILFAVVNIAVVGTGAYFVYASTIGWTSPQITEEQLAEQHQKEEEKSSSEAENGPLVYTMDKFTANLAGEPKRMIRVEVNLEMLGKDGFEEIINPDHSAKARDRIMKILEDKSFADLETIQGKLFLKEKIATEINALLDQGVVKDVYFSEFVVQ
jgi:flagellar FliL protein